MNNIKNIVYIAEDIFLVFEAIRFERWAHPYIGVGCTWPIPDVIEVIS